ncbi:MAG: ribonuclease Z [Candidatus Pacearchaeota archaeon]
MSNKIKITFLGTGGVIPTAKRNHIAIFLEYDSEGILVDCGEGTQRQFRKAKINPGKITKLLITHWHGDHILGIPGLLQTLALSGYKKTLKIYGPSGTKKFIGELLHVFHFVNEIKIEVKELDKEGIFFEDKNFLLESKKMSHGCPCNAYVFIEKGKLRIDKKKLLKSKLPFGPLLQKIKEGKDVVHNGKKYKAKDLTYMQGEKKISFVLDTGFNDKIVPLAKDSDLIIIESTYADDMKETAKDYKHLTSSQSAEIAKKAKVKKMILTHISQRYDKNPKRLLNEAREIFKNSFLVEDLESVEI